MEILIIVLLGLLLSLVLVIGYEVVILEKSIEVNNKKLDIITQGMLSHDNEFVKIKNKINDISEQVLMTKDYIKDTKSLVNDVLKSQTEFNTNYKNFKTKVNSDIKDILLGIADVKSDTIDIIAINRNIDKSIKHEANSITNAITEVNKRLQAKNSSLNRIIKSYPQVIQSAENKNNKS